MLLGNYFLLVAVAVIINEWFSYPLVIY